jgi:hypothetical protein
MTEQHISEDFYLEPNDEFGSSTRMATFVRVLPMRKIGISLLNNARTQPGMQKNNQNRTTSSCTRKLVNKPRRNKRRQKKCP